jgi:hypothetical protein
VGGTNGYLSWVPAGIPIAISGNSTNPYNSSGFSKANLNDYLALPPSTALNGMANLIRRNLPNFTNRAGGMNGANYALALAANIIDYADIDSSATSTNASGVNIIGFDNYPMLTHVFDQFLYNKNGPSITIITYLQFWNPSSIATPALTGGNFSYKLNDTIRYPTNTSPLLYTNTNLSSSTLPNSNFTFGPLPFSFSPNSGFITSITNTIPLNSLPNFPASAPTSLQLNQNASGAQLTTNNSYTLVFLSTTNIPAMSMIRYDHILNNGITTNVGTILGLRIAGAIGNPPWRTADPRMTTYLGAGSGSRYDPCAYHNTYFKGYPAQQPPSGPLYANPSNWPDGPNFSDNPLPMLGVTNQFPFPTGAFTNTNSAGVTDPAPCKISSFGSYTNICELGNIFDPIQWAPPTTSAITNYANVDIPTGTTWTSNNLYGGGSTLRIGRAEHSRFAFTNFGGTGNPIPNMGQSAAALLDLFCVTNGNNNNNGGGPFRTGGKININTAPYPVLAALAGGIVLAKDPNKAGNTTNALMINAFANGVMRFRHLYPFLSPSQLLFISVNYGLPNWTNSAVWSNAAVFSRNQGLQGVASINDEGLEEWFSKIYELSSVSSDNYRVYIVAQLVATNAAGQTNAIGPIVRKYVHFSSRPNTGSTPFSESTNGVVKMYNWTITKGLKKTYESPY